MFERILGCPRTGSRCPSMTTRVYYAWCTHKFDKHTEPHTQRFDLHLKYAQSCLVRLLLDRAGPRRAFAMRPGRPGTAVTEPRNCCHHRAQNLLQQSHRRNKTFKQDFLRKSYYFCESAAPWRFRYTFCFSCGKQNVTLFALLHLILIYKHSKGQPANVTFYCTILHLILIAYMHIHK